VALRLPLRESALAAVINVNHSTECHPEDKILRASYCACAGHELITHTVRNSLFGRTFPKIYNGYNVADCGV
jgi:hypothetical protein